MKYQHAKEMMAFIDNSPSMYHSVENLEKMAQEAGFEELFQDQDWALSKGGKYYVKNNHSSIILVTLGSSLQEPRLNIVGSHADSPTFKLKPQFEFKTKDHFLSVNVEPYGGAIYSTWYDRPLSVAGRVCFEKEGKIVEKNMDVDQNLMIIPNVAIHMNRDINKGYSYNEQVDLLPLMGMVKGEKPEDEGDYLLSVIAENLGVNPSDILDFDLYLYERQKGVFVGKEDAFFLVGKIDNLGMAFLSAKALIDGAGREGAAMGENDINMACVFDNEEVGSRSRQGAGSPFFRDTIFRIVDHFDQGGYYKAIARSFLISADQAHSVHPNHLEYSDRTNYPMINQGPVIKYAANQSYTTDAFTASVIKSICKSRNIPVQSFVNRSDKRGGSTIGPITMGKINIPSVDIGAPILAMHSVKELGGSLDQEYMYQLFAEFYTGKYYRFF